MKRRHHALLPALLLIGSLPLAGCASTPEPVGRAKYELGDFVDPETPGALAVSDPIETTNRNLYRFNYYFVYDDYA